MLQLEDWIVPVHYLRRAVSFAELEQSRDQSALSLDAMLDELRREGGETTAKPGAETGSLAPDRRFIRRDTAFYTLELALQWQHVVVVHGPAGTGKTELAKAGTGKTELAKAFGRWWRDTGGVDDANSVFFHAFEPGIASFGLDALVTSIGLTFSARISSARPRTLRNEASCC